MNRLWSRPSSSCAICKILVESSRAETTGNSGNGCGIWMAEEREQDMPPLVGLQESRSGWEQPLDEAAWRAGVAKGSAQRP